MNLRIQDILLEHPAPGIHCLQAGIVDLDSSKSMIYQWPLHLGQTIDQFAMELHSFASKLQSDSYYWHQTDALQPSQTKAACCEAAAGDGTATPPGASA